MEASISANYNTVTAKAVPPKGDDATCMLVFSETAPKALFSNSVYIHLPARMATIADMIVTAFNLCMSDPNCSTILGVRGNRGPDGEKGPFDQYDGGITSMEVAEQQAKEVASIAGRHREPSMPSGRIEFDGFVNAYNVPHAVGPLKDRSKYDDKPPGFVFWDISKHPIEGWSRMASDGLWEPCHNVPDGARFIPNKPIPVTLFTGGGDEPSRTATHDEIAAAHVENRTRDE